VELTAPLSIAASLDMLSNTPNTLLNFNDFRHPVLKKKSGFVCRPRNIFCIILLFYLKNIKLYWHGETRKGRETKIEKHCRARTSPA